MTTNDLFFIDTTSSTSIEFIQNIMCIIGMPRWRLSNTYFEADVSVFAMNLICILIDLNFLSFITSPLYKSHMNCQLLNGSFAIGSWTVTTCWYSWTRGLEQKQHTSRVPWFLNLIFFSGYVKKNRVWKACHKTHLLLWGWKIALWELCSIFFIYYALPCLDILLKKN